MKDYSLRYVPRSCATDRADRLELLSSRLEASANRLCELQDRLMTSAASMPPIELERLLDEYRAEQVRYDRLDRELAALEEPKKTKEYIEGRRIYQQYKNKIKY